jgi:predicted nuclease with TOPRIM domain
MYTSTLPFQDNLADAEEKIEKLITQKADYESQLKELEERLLDQEDETGEMVEKNKKLAEEVKDLKADVEDLENSLAKVSVFHRFFTYLHLNLHLKK